MLKPRDQQIAELIATTEAGVEALARRVGSSVEHATAQDAPAHAALYEHVQGCLTAAAKQLRRAHEVMLNGNPEDYSEQTNCPTCGYTYDDDRPHTCPPGYEALRPIGWKA